MSMWRLYCYKNMHNRHRGYLSIHQREKQHSIDKADVQVNFAATNLDVTNTCGQRTVLGTPRAFAVSKVKCTGLVTSNSCI